MDSTTTTFRHYHDQDQPEQGLQAASTWLKQDHALMWYAFYAQQSHPLEALLAAKLAQSLDDNPERQAPRVKRIKDNLAKQAGDVIWTIRNLNQPIQQLLDNGIIANKDLMWAAQNAYDPKIKHAAQVLLQLEFMSFNVSVKQSKTYQPAKIIPGKSYSEYKDRVISLYAGMSMGCYFTLFAVYVGWIIWSLITVHRFPHFSLWLLLIMGAFAFVFKNGLEFLMDQSFNHRRGKKGEDEAAQLLQRHLNQDWTIFKNITLPNHKDDIDLVLCGPSGVYVIEVKAWCSECRVKDEQWQIKAKKGPWKAAKGQPHQQAKRNAVRLKKHLNQHNIDVKFVQPVVFWLPVLFDDEIGKRHTSLERQGTDPLLIKRHEVEAWCEQQRSQTINHSAGSCEQIMDVLNKLMPQSTQLTEAQNTSPST
jgi:hypothetical protein